MKKKLLIGLLAGATVSGAIATPTIMNNQSSSHSTNKILMVNNSSTSANTNEAVIISGDSTMNLYGLSNGSGIISNLSTGEMLTILSNQQGNYCKVKVQKTGAIGYININNMQNIVNGTNSTLTKISSNGRVVNVSSRLRFRNNPSIDANIIGHLTNGTQFNILGKQGQWYKISINGQIGFIYEEYVSINGTNTTNNNDIYSSTTSNSNKQNNKITSNSITSNVNSSSNNHVKNIIVKAKITSTSNSSSSTNNSTGSNSVRNTTKLNSQNASREKNNSNLSNYFGTWKVSKNVGHSIEGVTENAPSLIGSKLELTNDLYSFAGVTIKNPYYYIQNISARDLFGQDGVTGILKNQEILNRLIVSSKPLSTSEFQNMALNNTKPTIILNNSNMYVFGGGKNRAQIDNISKSSSNTNDYKLTSNTTSSNNISYTVPSSFYPLNTVLVTNQTGKPITSEQLNTYLRSWILTGQNQADGICAASGTLWLKKVPNSTVYEAFIKANGKDALSKSITSNEFLKAAQELNRLTAKNVPFTLPEAKKIILQMLKQDGYATPSQVTKIVFIPGSPGVYEVYTKESKNYVFWTVYANTGYAHG